MINRTTRFGNMRMTIALSMAFVLIASIVFPATFVTAQDADCAEWSSETLEIMAPAAPGGGWDGTARELQAAMQAEGVVETVEVFNVEGAGGTIGLSELVSEHAGNEHMMMVMGLVMTGAIALNDSPVDLSQVTPISRLTTEYEVIVVPADSEFQTIDDLMAAFVEDPGAVSWAGGSAGGVDHLLVGLLAQEAGVDPAMINYVPFSGGGEALSSILGGQTTAGVSGLGEWQGQIESGDLRALAISGDVTGASNDAGATPVAATPSEGGDAPFGADIPTLTDSGIDIELANWRGIVAPPEISPEAQACMVAAVESTTQSQTWLETLARFGWSDYYLAGDEFGAFMADEADRVTTLLEELGLIG